MTDEVTLTVDGNVARIALERPDSGNLVTPSVVRGIELACDRIRDNDEIRCAVISGGASFSRGWDLDSFANAPADTLAREVFACVATLPQPVIAAIEGDVAGGGIALALAADIRVASESASFGLPDVSNGLVPLAGTINRLVRAVGRGAALSLILTGERIDAAAAQRIGLVSEVVRDGGTLDVAQELARQIAERGPIAIRYAKEAISRGAEMPLEQALRFETDLTILLQTTRDRAEGVRAFMEKRPPNFTGE